MRTAVDWVHDEIEKIWKKDPNFDEIRKIIDQAKEMEKQQIIKAAGEAYEDMFGIEGTKYGEKYFIENFKDENNG